jgi:hypothetical protein
LKAFVEVKRSSGFADELVPAGELLRAVKVMDQELAGQHVTVWASDDFHERRLTSDLRSDRLQALQAQLAGWLVSSRRSRLISELKLGHPVDLAEGFLFAQADGSGNGVSTRPFASAEDHGLNVSMSSVSGLIFVLIQAHGIAAVVCKRRDVTGHFAAHSIYRLRRLGTRWCSYRWSRTAA